MLDIERDFSDIIKYVEGPKPMKNRVITNYETLRKCGFNGKSKIYDTTPMSLTNMTFGEFMNIEPKGLTRGQLQAYYNKRRDKIAELCEIQHDQKQRVKKARQKQRIRSFIADFKMPMFCTITFTDEILKKDYNRKIKAIMTKLNVDYCLVSDYGEETCRLHYHGFIGLKGNYSDFIEFFTEDLNHKSKGKVIYHCDLLEKVGFNSFVFINTKNQLDMSLNYCVKYMTKDLDLDKTHRVLRSRTKQQEKTC